MFDIKLWTTLMTMIVSVGRVESMHNLGQFITDRMRSASCGHCGHHGIATVRSLFSGDCRFRGCFSSWLQKLRVALRCPAEHLPKSSDLAQAYCVVCSMHDSPAGQQHQHVMYTLAWLAAVALTVS